jgi:hypothetical protein
MKNVRGLSLPAIGRWKIEFWYAPRGYEIKEHTHKSQDIKLIPIFCHNVVFHRTKKGEFLGETFWARFKDIGHIFNIKAGDKHYFSVSEWPLIFMNIEYWYIKPTSASDDLQLTESI